MKFPHLIFAVCVLAAVFLPAVPTHAQTAGEKSEKISPGDLGRIIADLDIDKFYGGVMIAAGESRPGPVLVLDGVLDIQDGGTLDGDAWIVGGKLIMTGGARVRGRVVLVNSEIFVSRSATVGAGIERYRCDCRFDAKEWEESGTVEFEKYTDPMEIRIRPKIAAGTPKRVQYTVLRAGLVRRNPRRPDPYVSGHVLADIPLWSSTHGHFGFDAELHIPLRGLSIGLAIRGYKKVFSNDYWQVSSPENAAILLLTGYEFADYHESRGAEVGLDFRLWGYLGLSLTAAYRKDYSLETGRAPSLFNSNQRLPDNPAIDDGVRTTVSAAIVYDSREEPESPGRAWYAALWGEAGFARGPGEFSYEALQLDARKYSPLPYELQLDIGARLFSTFDRAPRQVFQSLGGYGGVRGLPDRPFDVRRGDRLVLLSGELRRQLPDVPVFRSLFTEWNLLVFYDTGLLVEAENPTDVFGFLETPYRDWGKSVGLGITGESVLPYVGLYVARDLDGGYDGVRVILRIKRSF
jgi:hypothetical protein